MGEEIKKSGEAEVVQMNVVIDIAQDHLAGGIVHDHHGDQGTMTMSSVFLSGSHYTHTLYSAYYFVQQ